MVPVALLFLIQTEKVQVSELLAVADCEIRVPAVALSVNFSAVVVPSGAAVSLAATVTPEVSIAQEALSSCSERTTWFSYLPKPPKGVLKATLASLILIAVVQSSLEISIAFAIPPSVILVGPSSLMPFSTTFATGPVAFIVILSPFQVPSAVVPGVKSIFAPLDSTAAAPPT